MSNAVNADTNEMAYYASNGVFTADGPSLDPTIPWSKTLRPGHVTPYVGCDKRLGHPRTFSANKTCKGGARTAVLIRSEETGGIGCFSIFNEQTRRAGSSWWNYDRTCSVHLPSGKARTGRATQHEGAGWYTSF